jgi:hypothetical protein
MSVFLDSGESDFGRGKYLVKMVLDANPQGHSY